MVTMMVFTDVKKMKKANQSACSSIIQEVKATGTVPEDIVDVMWKAFGME